MIPTPAMTRHFVIYTSRMKSSFVGSIVAGICFVVACVLLTTYIPFDAYLAATFALSTEVRMGYLMFLIVAFGITLILHMRAYARLGISYNAPLLQYSTYELMAGLGAFTASIVFLLAHTLPPDPVAISYGNTMIGLFALVTGVAELVFLTALIRLRNRFGWSWLLVVTAIAPLAVIYTWQPWPAAIAVALSSFFLYRVAKR